MEMISLSFVYNSATYQALIRIKSRDQRTEYHVTIMNGDLEKSLWGYHVIVEESGMLLEEGDIFDEKVYELRQSIITALHEYVA